jgi:hypothetical protein
MKVLRTSMPMFTSDIEAAVERYEALTREAVRQRFELPERGVMFNKPCNPKFAKDLASAD